MTEYQIIDNAFDVSVIEKFKTDFLGTIFPWFYTSYVSTPQSKDGEYFSHIMYNNFVPTSEYYNFITPVLKFLNAKALIRIKVNLFPKTLQLLEHDWHVDYSFPHKGALLYVNSNNGFTILKDGTKIESVENRIMLFDPSVSHKSTTCTDQDVRLTLVVNYF